MLINQHTLLFTDMVTIKFCFINTPGGGGGGVFTTPVFSLELTNRPRRWYLSLANLSSLVECLQVRVRAYLREALVGRVHQATVSHCVNVSNAITEQNI
jgi:hypothetical protein